MALRHTTLGRMTLGRMTLNHDMRVTIKPQYPHPVTVPAAKDWLPWINH